MQLLFVLGAKLEHIISSLAKKVVDQQTVVVGELVVIPSDDLFWFKSPKLVLFSIHYILFQNAFEIAFFFWVLVKLSFTIIYCIDFFWNNSSISFVMAVMTGL
jgi:mlo protein